MACIEASTGMYKNLVHLQCKISIVVTCTTSINTLLVLIQYILYVLYYIAYSATYTYVIIIHCYCLPTPQVCAYAALEENFKKQFLELYIGNNLCNYYIHYILYTLYITYTTVVISVNIQSMYDFMF